MLYKILYILNWDFGILCVHFLNEKRHEENFYVKTSNVMLKTKNTIIYKNYSTKCLSCSYHFKQFRFHI